MKDQIENFIKKILKGETQFFYFEKPSKYRDHVKQGISYKGDFFYTINNKKEECESVGFFPKDLMPSLLIPNEKSYTKYVYNIEKNIDLVVETYKGSISGVGYGEGWRVIVGIHYYGIMINIYSFKTSKEEYEIKGILSDEFYSWIDLNKFENVDFKGYFSDYSMFDSLNNKAANYIKLLQLYQEGDKFFYYDSFTHVLGHDEQKTKEVEEIFSKLNFKTFVVCDIYRMNLDLPEECSEIVFEFREKEKTPNDYFKTTVIEKRKQSIESLSKYKDLFSDKKDKEKSIKIEEARALQQKAGESVKIVFNHKGLSGIVFTNLYSYEKMLKHYEQEGKVLINVLDQEIKIDLKEFKKCLSVDKIKKKRKAYDYSAEYIGNFGVIGWWNKSFDNINEIYKY